MSTPLLRQLMKMLLIAGACLLAVSGCSPEMMPTAGKTSDDDPFESFNRGMYQFNYAFDGAVLKPVTIIYRGITPEPAQEMASNFLANLYTPVTFGNSVIQLDPQNSFAALWRFIINSSFGIGGVFDVASEAGLKMRHTDFGQTLAMYGWNSGPYVVLPVIGPSNTRDSFGRLVDAFMNPFNYAGTGESIAMWSATAVDKRSANMQLLDDIYQTSLDPYTTFRSGYTQKRTSDIRRSMEARDKAWEKARQE